MGKYDITLRHLIRIGCRAFLQTIGGEGRLDLGDEHCVAQRRQLDLNGDQRQVLARLAAGEKQAFILGYLPTTMQPSAGPWLSPKVVTVKSLPIVLPDIELFRVQQKDSAPTALEIEPGERQLRKRAAHRCR